MRNREVRWWSCCGRPERREKKKRDRGWLCWLEKEEETVVRSGEEAGEGEGKAAVGWRGRRGKRAGEVVRLVGEEKGKELSGGEEEEEGGCLCARLEKKKGRSCRVERKKRKEGLARAGCGAGRRGRRTGEIGVLRWLWSEKKERNREGARLCLGEEEEDEEGAAAVVSRRRGGRREGGAVCWPEKKKKKEREVSGVRTGEGGGGSAAGVVGRRRRRWRGREAAAAVAREKEAIGILAERMRMERAAAANGREFILTSGRQRSDGINEMRPKRGAGGARGGCR